MLKDTGQRLTLEAEKHRNSPIAIEGFLSCVNERNDRRPDTNFMRMNLSSSLFGLDVLKINYRLQPKLELAKMIILATLPANWNVFDQASLPTKLENSTLSVTVINPPGSLLAEIKGEVFGQASIGHPTLIAFPFVIEIPTKAEPLSLSLQDAEKMQLPFSNLLKLGGVSSVFPSFTKTILTDVMLKKLTLQFPATLTGSFQITEFRIEVPSKTKWNFSFYYLENLKMFYTPNHTLISGEVILGKLSLHCQLEWPPSSQGALIELSKSADINDISFFVDIVYRTFYGNGTLQQNLNGLVRTKLSDVPGFSLQKASFYLAKDLSFRKVTFTGALRKYSWELLSEFFDVANVFLSIDIDVRKPFAAFIRGVMVLVGGNTSIPFEMNVPSSPNQTLTIGLPANRAPRVSFQQVSGMLVNAISSKFPQILESFLPELVIEKLKISFDEKMTVYEINEFRAVCSTSWDLGGIGVLSVSNATVIMSPRVFKLRGFLLLGNTHLELELKNSSAGQVFSLVKPVNATRLDQLVKDALKRMVPGLKILPEANRLGLDIIDASLVQSAEVTLSNNYDSLNSFALEVQITKAWSFFQSCCSLIAPSMNLRVIDLNDISSYTLSITGSLELVDNKKRLMLPLECNIPDSHRPVITLKLKSEVIFNLSKIAVLPLVGKVIPTGLLTPISDIIGNVRLWPLEANFESFTASLTGLNLTATALKHWNLDGFLTLQNITLDVKSGQAFQATLLGMFLLKAHPISFQILFAPTLPDLPEMKIGFQELPGITLREIGQRLIGGFVLEKLFPSVFDKLKVSLNFLNLRLSPPLTKLEVQTFSLGFSLKDQVTLMDKWLKIEDITAQVNVKTASRVSVAGRLACLISLGTESNVIQSRGVLTMPHLSSSAWELNIHPDKSNSLSAAKIVALTGGGFDLKSLFPDKILSKANKFELKSFKAAFSPNPRFRVSNITCVLEANLSDVWLPLEIKFQHVVIQLFVKNPFDAIRQTVKATVFVELQIGKTTVSTVLSVYNDYVRLKIENLTRQRLNIYDLASLIGGDQLLKTVPVAFLRFNTVTLNSLSVTFSKPQFDVLNASIRCDLHGFDVGFSFPLPMADPSNVFKASLAVETLELDLKKNKDWQLTASIKASFNGIPLERHFSDLQGLITVTSRSATLTIKKKLLDVGLDKKLAGIDCNLNIKFSDLKIVFSTGQTPELGIALDISGFDVLNKLLPFKVFKNRLEMDVVITKKTGLALKLKTIPILDNIIPCTKNEEEYTCDFTWLCQEDSFVNLKLPNFAYTKDGFSAIMDIQGLERLCIPLTLPFLRQFFRKIPFLYDLLKANIPLWPPPDVIGHLRRIGCNIANLPKGMERFRNPEFPKEITVALSVAENGPLAFSLEVQNGESVNVILPVTPGSNLAGFSLSRFSIGTASGVPYVDISTEIYLWDLLQLLLLSNIPKQSFITNAEEMETRIICKDCFFIIEGAFPIPIFAAPLSIKYPTLINLHGQVTIYHRRPDYGEIGSLLVRLLKFYTDVNYLLSFDDFKNSTLLLVKLSDGNEETMIKLPMFTGGAKLNLNVPPIDAKRFYVGYMNFWKTWELKWLLQVVPLRYRVLDTAFNIGPFRWHLLKFAATTPAELKKNKDIWPYALLESGDDALVIASADLRLLSIDAKFRMKNFGNASLSLKLQVGIKSLISISLTAETRIQLEDPSNPVTIFGNAQVKLSNKDLLSGEARVSIDMISLSGELKFNIFDVLAFSGKVKAEVYSPGPTFALDADAAVHLLGIRLSKSHLYIQVSPLKSVIKATAMFMGSSLNIDLIVNGLSFNVQAQARLRFPLEVDLGKISVGGVEIGGIALNTGFDCDLKISFPGRSTMTVSFRFMGITLKLSLTFNTRDARPDRIRSLLLDLIKDKAPALLKDLFLRNPREILRALVEGVFDLIGDPAELIKNLLKTGLNYPVKELGKFLNDLVDTSKAISEAAERFGRAAAQAAAAAREAASRAVEAAGRAVEQAGKIAQRAGTQLAEAGKALEQSVRNVIRVDNAVEEARRVFENISKRLQDAIKVISKIAQKIKDEIARGIRNLAGKVKKVIKAFESVFGKRSIYRRDALSQEKREHEKKKRKLQRNRSDQKTRVRAKERELERARKEEQLRRNLRDAARKESLRATGNLNKAYNEKAQKRAVFDDIINMGKCVTGENNCHPNATCLRKGPEGQLFKCVCRQGWIGNGTFCERPIRGVTIISDSPKAVGEAILFSAFALSGTNVQYKYSFNSAFSQYGFASYTFNSPGVYDVGIFAKNHVSNDTASDRVVVQIPVMNITLSVSGDRRACRALRLSPSASGTNVSFTIDFGDNTSLYNVTETVTHHFPRSGTFVINITASNLVSTNSQTFVLNISSSPCDDLFCDILALETTFSEKTVMEISSLAWSLLHSTESGNGVRRYNLIWKYLSLFYPVSYSVLKMESSTGNTQRNLDRQYRISGAHVEIDFILAGMLSSQIGHIDGSESSLFLPNINNPLAAFTWITSILLSTDEFASTWNTSRARRELCQERLPISTISSAIDGFILGTQLKMTNLSEGETLSDILFDYYCPSNPNVQYSWKNRYKRFYNLSKMPNSDGNWDAAIITSTFLNQTSNLEGFIRPLKDFCLSYFLEVLWSAFNATEFQKGSGDDDTCRVYATCQQCIVGGTSSSCFWCEGSHACLSKEKFASCSQHQTIFSLPCSRTCHHNQRCSECVSKYHCGWCESSLSEDRPVCAEGGPARPRAIAFCSPSEWYHGTCTSSCPTNQGRLCSGKGICKNGECYCLSGYYGDDCSERGCVYMAGQNDTLQSLSILLNVSIIDIQTANKELIRNATAVAVNVHLTIPKPEKSLICLSIANHPSFHQLFPRMLRISKNRAGLQSFCGLFGSVASESKKVPSCRSIDNREHCLRSGACTWNIREPCTGILLQGCFRLTHWLDLLVNQSQVIYSPISGNVKTTDDSIQITGWPKSEWAGYIVFISHLEPFNISSVQSGQIIGTALTSIGSVLPNFVRLSVAQDSVYKDPLEYLLPCSPGCSQVKHFYNGICDEACNTEQCNHDNGECTSNYNNQSDFLLQPRSIRDFFSVTTLKVLYHLQTTTGEKSIDIARGPLSLYSLAKMVVLEILDTSDLHSPLVFRNYRRRVVKFVEVLLSQNTSIEKLTLLTAEKVIELGVHRVSPFGSCGADYDIAELKTSSLQNKTNFQIGLDALMEARLLFYTLAQNYSGTVTPYFHLQIPRQTIKTNKLKHYDPTQQVSRECNSLTSCSGHGVCMANGSCYCDLFYTGKKCQINNCPESCSGHGNCIEGVCVCNFGWDGNDCSKIKLCTPLCPQIWIGDGVCDPDCDTLDCLQDKGDCRNVCICPDAWLGDRSCDQVCNNTLCNYDGGDCVEKECSPGCRSVMLADGICDPECNTELCGVDEGDCSTIPTCSCSQNLQGNGVCNEDCNVAACLYDYGDCTLQVTGENCPPACSPPMVGNGFCDLPCNVSACNFDGEDCYPAKTASTIDLCFEGCLPSFRGDGECDSVCNVRVCNFDDNDCPKPIVQECSPKCQLSMVGDGICQSQCKVEECSFDASDCQCAPGCSNASLGDGICNVDCFVEPCNYDNMDCICSSKKCPKEYLGNGHCDLQCNSRICDYDGGDCTCSNDCPITSIGDGSCDPACDTRLCDFDGLDCGGCESENHFNICDENAECIVTNGSLPFLQCQCKKGFYGDGFSCVERGNCFNASNICSPRATCKESNGTFECYCNPGWIGNGIFCENKDECNEESHNCSINSKCVDLPGEYKCICKAGWVGDGYNCTDVNECELNRHSCCANEDCINTKGNYTCTCKPGWREKRNSTPATLERCTFNTSFMCVDIDECAEERHNCSTYEGQANAICINTIGGFQCSCSEGWQGDGFYCNDINECVNSTVCSTNQLCRNMVGNYSCSCKEGWTLTGSMNDECQDLDECTLGLDDCDTFASCINTNGSFRCECMEGFQDTERICTKYHCRNQTNRATSSNVGNNTATSEELCTCVGEYMNTGRTCVDVDECKWSIFHCPPATPICQNLIGGYECKCDAVDNSSCDPVNPCDSSNNTCEQNMTCIAVGMEHYCVCPEGYTEDQNATACIDVDECINPNFYGSCDPNADCINLNGSFECKCRAGFFQSGDGCFEIDECEGKITRTFAGLLEECKVGVCATTETCIYRNISSDGSDDNGSTLLCACDDSDNSKIDCVEAIVEVIQSAESVTTIISIPLDLMVNTSSNATTKNRTSVVHNCTKKATCNNTVGSYECICQEGYERQDGGRNCEDRDECLANDTCHANATCLNTDGSFSCECKSGFTGNGLTNCSDVDECSLKIGNCTHNSFCVNTAGSYICTCLEGFQRNGTLLCEDMDECSSTDLNNCHPRASCENSIGGYNCSCLKGYSGNGFTCSDIDECRVNSILCAKHASCYNTLGSYKCKCDPGWSGDGQTCTNIDECSLGLHTCVENSYCIDNQGSYTCPCNRGWKRQWFEPYGRCSRCDPNLFCSGHGQCLRNGTCDCLSYYSGQNCSVCRPDVRCSGHGTCDFNGNCYCEHGWTRQPLDCSICLPETLCSGHGTCNYDLITYKNQSCFCDDRYFGNNCSKACPFEKGEVCGPNGYCNRDPGALYPCVCFSGYQWNDSSSFCEDVDECLLNSHHCLPPARCINTPGSYRCQCPSLVGWSFDGRSCNDTDECQYPNVCDPQAACVNFPGGFNCSCNLGWRGQGAHPTCSDINECAEGTNKCPNPSRCVNTLGSYYCVCDPGWEKVSEFQCTEIDECSRGIDGCDPNSACKNTPGSWKCTCNNGWYPYPSDARLPTCKDVNECVEDPNACPVQSLCVNSVGSYHCNCLSGWRNRGPHACDDINECYEGSYSCPSKSRCINTQGSYQCHCNSGYTPPITTTTCQDVDECAIGSHSCSSYGNAYCVNTIGSYTCQCYRCYYMSGSSCQPDCRLVTRYYYVRTYTSYTTYYTTSCGLLFRCRASSRKRKSRKKRQSHTVWVSNRHGARCPC